MMKYILIVCRYSGLGARVSGPLLGGEMDRWLAKLAHVITILAEQTQVDDYYHELPVE